MDVFILAVMCFTRQCLVNFSFLIAWKNRDCSIFVATASKKVELKWCPAQKKKNGVEFLTGIHNLGYLPHELLSPECDDCFNCVVDGLSPSGFEGGGLMWRLPI